jgi:hypothetical protein
MQKRRKVKIRTLENHQDAASKIVHRSICRPPARREIRQAGMVQIDVVK